MTGPPTPPPSSETELRDQARTDAPAVPATSEPVAATAVPQGAQPRQTPQDVYHFILPILAKLGSGDEYSELIHVAEYTDLNSENDQSSTRLLLTAPLVLAYMILDDLPPARYALNRLPDSTAATPLAQILFNLLASACERKHARVYSRAEILLHMVGQADFPDSELASLITAMTTTFVESFRQRTSILLSKAYTSIPLLLAQTYFGLPPDKLVAAAEKNSWTYDPSTQIFKPVVLKSSIQVSRAGPSSLATFERVADRVIRLEL